MLHNYRNLLALIFGSTLLLASSIGMAKDQNIDGWYFSGAGGLAIQNKAKVEVVITTGEKGDGDLSYNNGYAFTGAIGKYLGDFRLEGEISYRRNDPDFLTLRTDTIAGSTLLENAAAKLEVEQSSLGFMINGLYDFKNNSKFTPFVLGGIGVSLQTLDISRILTTATFYDESDTVIAFQAGGGISYAVAKNNHITLQYRYFGSEDPEFDDSVSLGVDKITIDNNNHNLMIGFTRSF